MDAAHWHQQGLGLVKPMEDMLMVANAAANPSQQGSATAPMNPPPPSSAAGLRGGGGGAPTAGVAPGGAGAGTERRARPQKEKALNCPRCNSTNTKFCYYNNYSLQQPRYFCKTCRRYWTEGGSLRNVPVGGGSRKNKRSSTSSSTSASATTTSSSSMAIGALGSANKNPKLMTHHHEAGAGAAHDLNLAFPHHLQQGGAGEFAAAFPSLESSSVGNAMAASGNGRVGALSAMELLRSTGCYMPLHQVHTMQMPGDYAAAGFSFGEFRTPPSSQSVLGFSLDHAHASAPGAAAAGYGSGAGLHHGAGAQQENNAASRLLFPFEDLKPPVSSGAGDDGAGGGGASGGAAGDGHHQFEHGKEQTGGGGPGGAGHDTPPAGFWNGMIGGSGTAW